METSQILLISSLMLKGGIRDEMFLKPFADK